MSVEKGNHPKGLFPFVLGEYVCDKYFLNKNTYLLIFSKYLLFLQYNLKI